jgi:Cft2 family RNA processing exonuclease
MVVEFLDTGFFLPQIALWLDSTTACAATWISHGHSDHSGGCHGLVIGTPATLRFYRMRLNIPPGDPEPSEFALPYGESLEWQGARLTAYPAGHILGAAQLLIEYQGERLVYTGDIKLRPPLCGETALAMRCHHLIIESTFGLPIYQLLSREQADERIVQFAKNCFEEDSIPAFIGYALGRGQEIVHILCQAGIRTAVDGAIAKFIPVYEEDGYACPGWEPYDARAAAGKALVVVPTHGSALKAGGKNTRVAYVSGWAALDNARARTRAEELIPYSDHADFDELLSLVAGSEAKQIDVVHGYTEPFSRILSQRGFTARPHPHGARTNVEDAEG